MRKKVQLRERKAIGLCHHGSERKTPSLWLINKARTREGQDRTFVKNRQVQKYCKLDLQPSFLKITGWEQGARNSSSNLAPHRAVNNTGMSPEANATQTKWTPRFWSSHSVCLLAFPISVPGWEGRGYHHWEMPLVKPGPLVFLLNYDHS